jgi:hypothetical protein
MFSRGTSARWKSRSEYEEYSICILVRGSVDQLFAQMVEAWVRT